MRRRPAAPTASTVTLSRDDAVVLLRLACDLSGQPFSTGETRFLRTVGQQLRLEPDDNVRLP